MYVWTEYTAKHWFDIVIFMRKGNLCAGIVNLSWIVYFQGTFDTPRKMCVQNNLGFEFFSFWWCCSEDIDMLGWILVIITKGA